MIRVLVIADSAVVRAGLEALLREDGRFEPVRSDHGIQRLPLALSATHPEVILAETESRLRLLESAGTIPVVLLTDELNRGDLLRVLRAGARAILRRDAQPAEILAALEAAAAGLTAFSPADLRFLLPAVNGGGEEQGLVEALSAREAEVLALMSQGLANKNIADRLGISEHTVKFHVSTILSKLGASSRTEAVTKGLKDGLLVI